MYSVNGSTWQVLSTNAHASNILANMNAQLQAQGLPIITATTGNVLWFYCLAAGQEIAQNIDIPLSAAKNSFDLANCDDNQIYSLLPIAGTTLIPASYSSMYVTLTAAGTGPLIVVSGSHVVISGLTNKFITQSTVTIPAGQSSNVYTIADSTGPIIVLSGQANALVESYANFGSVTNTVACLIGSAVETATAARARLILGQTVGNNLNGVTRALRALPGILGANVYFNYGLTASSLTAVSGTISLPARTAYIVVQGQSANIASTYWNLMNAPTYGSQQQIVVTLSNQSISINYDYSSPQPVYVQVYIQNSSIINSGYLATLYAAINSIVPPVGVPLTSNYMLEQLQSYTAANIEGLLLSLTPSNYSVAVNIPVNAYAQFSNANISVILQ